MKIRLLVHKFASSSPRLIKNVLESEGFDVKRLLLSETTFKAKPDDLIVNWGCIRYPKLTNLAHADWLNPPEVVKDSTNRIKALRRMKEFDIHVPQFTTSTDEAQQWYDDGHTVVSRATIRSFGGHGILVREPGDEGGPIAPAALYTLYQPKRTEYRVHVFHGDIIDLQQKKRRRGFKAQGVESKIRSYDNGWIFCREGVDAPPMVVASAVGACTALQLDFAAVDVGWNEKFERATVYECNTAPGLTGTTLRAYANAIKAWALEI